MSNLIFILLTALFLMGIFISMICLQVYISKNNKRGKFVIPAIFFLLPILTIALTLFSFIAIKDSGAGEVQEGKVYTYVESDSSYESSYEDSSLSKDEYIDESYDDFSDEYYVDSSENAITTLAPIGMGIVLPMIFLSIPCAITTLMIELVYRSKRKRVPDEQVIDIKNM